MLKNRGELSKLFVIIFIIILIFIDIPLISSLSDRVGQLKVTLEHPFLVDGKWISASELEVGDELTTDDGKKVRITEIGDMQETERLDVYNLETADYHNFVIEDNLIVHNSNPSRAGRISRNEIGPTEVRAYVAEQVYYFDWGRKSARLGGDTGMKEIIFVDHADPDLARIVRQEYDDIFGKLSEFPEKFELELAAAQFAGRMNQKLPFLGWRNIDTLGRTLGPRAVEEAVLQHLKFLGEEGEHLSTLGRLGELDCTGQALTIREALGRESGWRLYRDVSLMGHPRAHTFLAKQFGTNYVIVDASELAGSCGHGFVVDICDWRYSEVNLNVLGK
jgi:hypothetical protein